MTGGEAEGLRLHLSSNNATGYLGVTNVRGRFQAKVQGAHGQVLGCYATAVEAAVAYARYKAGETAGSGGQSEIDPGPATTKGATSAADAAAPASALATVPAAAAPAPVRAFLAKHNLEEYADAFDAEGYDDFDYLLEVGRSGRVQIEEVAANVRMTKPGHVAKFCHYLGQLAHAVI